MKRIKTVYQLTLISFFLFFSKISICQDFFEGIITYKIDTELMQEDHLYNDYYSQKYGDTMVVYLHKEGYFKREYIGSGKMGYDWTIYDVTKNEYYGKWKSMDSIFFYNCNEVITELMSFNKGPDKKILGKNCKSIIVRSFEPKLKENLSQIFYYSGDEKVSPDVFSKFKDGYLDKVYSGSKSHILEWEFEQPYVRVKFTAVSIEKKNLDQKIFELPKGIPLINY